MTQYITNRNANLNSTLANHTKVGHNSFGLLRLLAAVAVVFSHAWSVTYGYNAVEPLQELTGFPLGWHAVHLFFALSGLLVAASLYHSNSPVRFAWARFLRIFPGLIVVALATLAFGYFISSEKWSFADIFWFMARNITLSGANATLPGVFDSNPNASEINVPLWTLKYEVCCYISLVLVFIATRFALGDRGMKATSLLLTGVCGAGLFFMGPLEEYGKVEHMVRFMFTFYLGVSAFYWRDHIKLSFVFLTALLAFNIGLLVAGVFSIPAQILLIAYSGAMVGSFDFGAITRFCDAQDYSYGIYIAGFPIQQWVMYVSGNTDPVFNFLASMPIVVLVAFLLWNLIEKPALKLKGLAAKPTVPQVRSVPAE